MRKFYLKNKIIFLLLLIISLIGILTYQDYGIGIEEHFQRKSGFYWLNFLLNYTDFEILKETSQLKLNEIETFTPRLFSIEKLGFYGILFDVPLAFIETLFKISEPQNYFFLRHLTIFFFFLISSFCFYRIIQIRFNNINLALFGFIAFIFSPRIYGNIFFDNKDIFFLSMVTINMFFFIKYLRKENKLNLIIFSMFCAMSTTSRIIGLLIPLSFFILIFLEYLSSKKLKEFLIKVLIFIFAFLIMLIIHWPYLWTLNFEQFKNFFEPFFFAMNPTVFFNGNFYQSKFLPISYIPIFIFISTPVFILLLFSIGFLQHIKRVFNRFINIKEKLSNYDFDFWRSKSEKFDFFLFLNFLLILILYFAINLALLSGWRHFYFLNFFIIFYSCYCLNYIFLNFKKILLKKIFLITLIILSVFLLYNNYKYHPFQSSYFNSFISNKYKKNFEIDTQSLSRVHAIKELLNEDGDLLIGTASYTPLEDARSLIPKKHWHRLNFVGTNYERANFIFTNFYYEVNTKYNKKYEIPENFSLYKSLIIDGTRIYSIYKKK